MKVETMFANKEIKEIVCTLSTKDTLSPRNKLMEVSNKYSNTVLDLTLAKSPFSVKRLEKLLLNALKNAIC